MADKMQSRLASALTIAAGIWLLLSPLAISLSGAALVSLYITAGIITAAGLIQLFWVNTLPSWLISMAAVWLFISAFAFTVRTAVTWNEAIISVFIFVLATWDGVEVSHFRREHQLRA